MVEFQPDISDEKAVLARVARSLAHRYEVIYHVDADSGAYAELHASSVYRELGLPTGGADFFADFRQMALAVVDPDDADAVIAHVARTRSTKRIDRIGHASITYRIGREGKARHATLHAMWADDRRHLTIGIEDATGRVRLQDAAAAADDRSRVLGRIAKSLANQYATIYYVDVYTKSYTEFSSSDIYKELGVAPAGEDFFEESRKNILRVIHPDDVEPVLAIMDRDRMTEAINRDGSVSITYRLLLGGEPVYTNMNATWTDDYRHIIVGVSDVHERHQRELEQRAAEERARIYAYIAQSLANQYATIYYVDVYTQKYMEFTSTDVYQSLEVPPEGDDFFATSRANARRFIHPDDLDAFNAIMDRDRMTAAISRQGSVSITYRLTMEGKEAYANLQAVWADDRRHLIIGVTDVDAAIRREMERKEAEERSITYANIAQSLANRYDSIYYVDAKTDFYTEYASTDEYKDLNVQAEGDDFFGTTAESIERLVYHEDREFALRCLDKRNLLAELDRADKFSVNYRLMMGGAPTYINLRAVWAQDRRHLIIGVANVDAEMRREHEHAKSLRLAHERALRDELTGVKNTNGYRDLEAALASGMEDGSQEPFAIVVCDVNGLKDVNDTLGHKAGNEYIRAACRLICDIFDHSPVFRIGGDEFAVVLRGQDYENRDVLLADIRATVLRNQEEGEVIVATGMSVYRAGQDALPSDVFKRADERMYANKATLKGARK